MKRAYSIRVNGRQIPLTGTFDHQGVTGTAGVVGAVAFVPVVGFFVTGTGAVLAIWGEVPAFNGEDVQLNMVDTESAASAEPVPTAAETEAVVEG